MGHVFIHSSFLYYITFARLLRYVNDDYDSVDFDDVTLL